MDLQEWNDALFDRLVKRGRPEDRLYLYVDRDVLADAGGHDSADAALDDFCSIFRGGGSRPFESAAQTARRWRAGGWIGEPEILAALAMTVLAVTEKPLGGAHGVYRRQNELLGLPPEAVAPAGYGDDVPELWTIWNAWLKGLGARYGHPSARTHKQWTWQGWARSQALIRYRDRLVLEDFFSGIRLLPRDARHPEVLAREFLTWLNYRGKTAAQLVERLHGEAEFEILTEVVEDEAARWDGTGRPRQTTGGLRGLLVHYDWSDTFGVAIPVDERVIGKQLNTGTERYEPDEFDPYVTLELGATDAVLLKDGAELTIAEGLRVRAGGEPSYVFCDEPLLGGSVQVRGSASATRYKVLVQDNRAELVARALRESGARPEQRKCAIPGWTWLDDVSGASNTDALRRLGVGSVADPKVASVVLVGGLPVAPATYLSGGEPNALVPNGGDHLILDGKPVEYLVDHGVVRLAREEMDVGRHILRADGEEVVFHTVRYIRESSSSSDLSWELTTDGRTPQLMREPQPADGRATLSGALLIRPDPVKDPPVMWIPDRCEALVVTAAGRVLQVWPEAERWLKRLEIAPHTFDVERATRGLKPSPVCFLTRSPRTGAVHALALPPMNSEGHVETRERTDLFAPLVSKSWEWVGTPKDEVRRDLLNHAMQSGPLQDKAVSGLGRRKRAPFLLLSKTVLAQERDGNPYNDVLEWLSERETSSSSVTQFAQAWDWSCCAHRLHEVANDWRLALYRLEMLGHVERDYERRRVGVASAALVSLPSANGLSVLTGSRPRRLLERLDDPDDTDDLVSEATRDWTLHKRTQFDSEGRPSAPTIVYIEWDRAVRPAVQVGLRALGISLVGRTSAELFHLQPTIGQILRGSTPLTLSPGNKPRTLQHLGPHKASWVNCQSDREAGLYSYRLPRGESFAWRPKEGGPLFKVDRDTGRWLDQRATGQSVIKHHEAMEVFFVPLSVPLPMMIRRALTLRTGMLPALVPALPNQGLTGTEHLAFENVDTETAELVGRLLGQSPVDAFSSLEGLW